MFFIDVQGTIIDDRHKEPIEGAITFVDYLNEHNIPYLIVTNNTKKLDFLDYLNTLGFNIDTAHYLDPLMVVQDAIKEKKVAVYGGEEFLNNIQTLGYSLEYEEPEAVLLSVKKDYNFEEFATINEFLLSGAKLYGMHSVSLYVNGGRRYVGTGALLEMFRYATSKEYTILGKPSTSFYTLAKSKLEAITQSSLEFKAITMISDDLKGDLMGAKVLGMQSALVLSGKIRSRDEIKEQPDTIKEDIYRYFQDIVLKELRWH